MQRGARLAAIASGLNQKAPSGLPALLLLTDPARTPDPLGALGRPPRGTGLIFRHFGGANQRALAFKLKAACRRRRLTLLIGADVRLAQTVRAHGVHLAERQTRRRCFFRGLVTAAAHSRRAAARAKAAGAQAVLLSPVFPSRSPSAGRPIGGLKARRLSALCPLPCYALGGVNERTAPLLKASAFIGLAAVDAWSAGRAFASPHCSGNR
ncbi:MAG: thiamine phosphate synthase [Alphaproteobacteria bacterium]|nr:thiamine phosphate synthase [Alphaproteobacteria bacterium]